MVAVQVREYPILVLQPAVMMYRGLVLVDGREGAGGRALSPEGAGREIGDGGRWGSGRSRYHGCSWPNGCESVREKRRQREGGSALKLQR
jgi:hypothetical protein